MVSRPKFEGCSTDPLLWVLQRSFPLCWRDVLGAVVPKGDDPLVPPPISRKRRLELEGWIKAELKQLSQESYVLGAAIAMLREEVKSTPEKISARFDSIHTEFPGSDRDRVFKEGGFRMQPPEVQLAADALPASTVRLLIIRLDALLHGFLDEFYSRDPAAEDSPQFEKDLAFLLRRAHVEYKPRPGKPEKPPQDDVRVAESYKLVILMACVRNAFVHTGGGISERARQRLIDVKWDEAGIEKFSTMFDEPTFSDFQNLKGAVRTVANRLLELAPERST